MSKLFFPAAFCLLLLSGIELPAQNLRFKTVLDAPGSFIVDMKQDKLGFFWLNNTASGLQKFDGVKLQTFLHDPVNPNSVALGELSSLVIDADNIIWVGTFSSGLDRLDPTTNTFTHFRHNAKDAFSLSNDTVNAILEDQAGNLWVGTNQGLDLLDRKTGRFTRYKNDQDEKHSASSPQVTRIFEDRKGALWICGITSSKGQIPAVVLNRFDRATKKFTPYLLDSAKANNSVPGTWVKDIYEDNKNNFWIVTDAGLYSMDRNTGKCTRHYPDPFHSGVLSQTPIFERIASDIHFVTEDSSGALWIGMGLAGLNRYDPVTGKSKHFGLILDNSDILSLKKKDTATGLNLPGTIKGISTKDGLFWVSGFGGIAQLNYRQTTLPFYTISNTALALYAEVNGKILWIGTDKGLLRKDLTTQKEKLLNINPKDNNIYGEYIFSIAADEKENLWLGTGGGLVKFDPLTEKFVHYKHDPAKPGSISSNKINYLFFDHNRNLWAASDSGISRMNKATEQFTNYNKRQIGANFNGYAVNRITEDAQHDIWLTANWGLYKLDIKTGKIRQYIYEDLRAICVDAKGRVWTGGFRGLYAFNKAKDRFELLANEDSAVNISGVLGIVEDEQKSLWVSTNTAIFRINESRTKIKKYSKDNGVVATQGVWSANGFLVADGRLFLGNVAGYYSFYPGQLSDNNTETPLNITSFKLGDKLVNADGGSLLTLPIWQTREIRLNHNQNIFSFDFFSADYISPGEKKYSYMLENHDNAWHDIGSEHRASFFNIPPGSYVFRVKAVSGDGNAVEKSIRIIVSPPWWETWWFRILSVIALVAVIYAIIKERSRKLVAEKLQLEQKVTERTEQLEKSLRELKATQAQLVQSEKMASLGELTAGIAHEIQNPLNFVNNFSELSNELIDEMQGEMEKGNVDDARQIVADIRSNLEKINQHGKRADAIVKGMLQHSRTSSGEKEPTELNALADEYLRLSFHGMRANDHSFNAVIRTEFDPAIGEISVIPQEIGRVLLNLYNNAFYAVHERAKRAGLGYQPTVTVSTRLEDSGSASEPGRKFVVVRISDNGNGIPEQIMGKIFQPFFTTKPTGQGTGLGLSLSYDIIRAHGGEMKVKSQVYNGAEMTEGGSEFIILLPVS